jgi:hypothetical protein
MEIKIVQNKSFDDMPWKYSGPGPVKSRPNKNISFGSSSSVPTMQSRIHQLLLSDLDARSGFRRLLGLLLLPLVYFYFYFYYYLS